MGGTYGPRLCIVQQLSQVKKKKTHHMKEKDVIRGDSLRPKYLVVEKKWGKTKKVGDFIL